MIERLTRVGFRAWQSKDAYLHAEFSMPAISPPLSWAPLSPRGAASAEAPVLAERAAPASAI